MKLQVQILFAAVVAFALISCCQSAGYQQPRRGHGNRTRRRLDGNHNKPSPNRPSSRPAPAVTPKPEGGPFCPMGYVTLNKTCYHFSDSPATWHQAVQMCRQIGGTLAVLDTGEKIWLLRRYLGHSHVAYLRRWIGPIYNWMMEKWIWGPTGEDVVTDDWSKDDRVDREEVGPWMCGAMDPLVSYQWEPVPCLNDLHYICETAPEIRKYDQPPFNYDLYQAQGDEGHNYNSRFHDSRFPPGF